MISKVFSAVIRGIEAVPVTIETDIVSGMPNFSITGLADATVKESAVRVKAAIQNSGYEFPRGRISINIAPAGMRKRGSALDLGIAVGILAATGQVLTTDLHEYLFAGELSLDGSVVRTPGILNITEVAKKCGLQAAVPEQNKVEAGMISGIRVYAFSTLEQVISHLNLSDKIAPYDRDERDLMMGSEPDGSTSRKALDFSDVKGQEAAKRALVIAASGGHGVLMTGSPSSGKTMLAERLPGIMPEMTHDEIIRATEAYSAAGLLSDDMPYVTNRPFRRPHHTITKAGLIGGGAYPRPGEITLASGGILFIDEFAEMDPKVADALREPLERKEIVLIRGGETYSFPADFLLIAASNPCRCGYYGDPVHECTCTPGEIMRYRMKLSGPIMDRIDIHLELKGVQYSDLELEEGLSTEEMRAMVIRARAVQKERFKGTGIMLNSEMTERMTSEMANISYEGRELLRTAYEKMGLNPRTLGRTIKIARTIADIGESDVVGTAQVGEALQYSRFSAEARGI